MDLFGDKAAILNSIVSNSYYGMLSVADKLVCFQPITMNYVFQSCNKVRIASSRE